MTDKRLQLALHHAMPAMRKSIMEFSARRFRIASIQLFYDTEQGDEVHVAFVDPGDPDGAAFVVHEDGSVSSY